MKVDYFHQKENFYGNIMWGKGPGMGSEGRPVNSESGHFDNSISKFRGLGYYASCFPEGDGMAIKDESESRSPDEVARDITSCFGWNVRIVNNER